MRSHSFFSPVQEAWPFYLRYSSWSRGCWEKLQLRPLTTRCLCPCQLPCRASRPSSPPHWPGWRACRHSGPASWGAAWHLYWRTHSQVINKHTHTHRFDRDLWLLCGGENIFIYWQDACLFVYSCRWVQAWHGWGQYVDSDYTLSAVSQQWTCWSNRPAEGMHGPLPKCPQLKWSLGKHLSIQTRVGYWNLVWTGPQGSIIKNLIIDKL